MSDNGTPKERLFQYAILLHPTPEECRAGKRTELLGKVETLVARGTEEAVLHAARSIPAEHLDKLNRVEVAVRPF